MARASMADLITAVRGLIGDKGETPTFTDEEIEIALDTRRLDYPLLSLVPRYTVTPTGLTEYREWFAIEGGDWEDSYTLQGASYETLTADESYPMQGRWVFDPPIQNGNVYLRGTRYDVNGAAADMVDKWLALVALKFDFSRGSRSYSRSQMRAGLLELQKTLRGRQWLYVGEQVRTDMAY